MMSNGLLSSVEMSLEQSSLYTTSGEQYGDVNAFTPSDSVFAESDYYAGTQYFSSTSYGEEFVEPSPTDYYDTSFVLDGYENNASNQLYGSYIPILYPVPTSYMLYNVAVPIEYHGAVFYNYEQFAVPVFSPSYLLTNETTRVSDLTVDTSSQQFVDDLEYFDEASSSSLLTSENTSVSDLTVDTSPQQFADDFEYFDETDPSHLLTNETTSVSDFTVDTSPQQFVDDLENFDEAGSLQLIPENDFVMTESKDEIKRKKDWLYLLSLSGKLSIKDRIPEVDVMTVILEEEENIEISNEVSDFDDGIDEESETNVSPEIDKSDGDTDQKYPDDAAMETSHNSSTGNETPEETFPDSGEEKVAWENSFFRSIDDQEFGIESCFNDSTFENEIVHKSFYNNGYKTNSNLPSRSGKTFMILGRLGKQIEILPPIEEEEEPVMESEKLHIMTEKPPLQINKEGIVVIEEGCLRSKQQNAEEMENSCGIAEATVKVGTSDKPKKKKRFKRIRRFFSELRSCFRKSEGPPG